MTDNEIALRLPMPPGWILLPVYDDVDASGWARATLAAGGGEPSEEAVRSLADSLTSARRGPVQTLYLPAVFQPDATAPILIRAYAVAYPWDADGPVSLDEFDDLSGQTDAKLVGEVTRGRAQLPAGPATWMRSMWESVDENGPIVVEQLTHWILPAGLDGFVTLDGQWVSLAVGDEFADRMRELAVRVAVEIGPPAG